MLVRIWRTDFDVTQKDKLLSYANNVSLPALGSRPGCRGVLFFSKDDRWTTMTIWQDQASIDALDDDADYRRIAEGILDIGVLGTDQSLEVCAYDGGALTTPLV